MIISLLLLTGFCWTVVYVELIHLGFKEKTYGMPFVALALNFAWEAFYSYTGLKYSSTSIETWIILLWLVLDTFVVFTYFLYGKKYFPPQCSQEYFLTWTLIIFIMSFTLQYFFFEQFKSLGQIYSAFIQNLIMSILFITMLVRRKNLNGQSLTIAFNKWIGTLAPTILFGVIYGNKLVLVLGIFCSIFDLIYIYFLNNIKTMRIKLSKSSPTKN